jgi:C1A family cysteine protease
MSIYSSFRPDEQGIIPIPSPRRDSLLGYHCLTCVGYTSKDIDDGLFIVKNSWGRGWGNKGFCLIPAKMLIDNSNAFDFWTVRPSSEFMVIDNNSTYSNDDNEEEDDDEDDIDNEEDNGNV